MRIIESRMIEAIKSKKNYNGGNTKVITNSKDKISRVYLFDNLIAEITDKKIRITNCGYKTKTTKSRLNIILREFVGDRCIYQKNFDWYISGEPSVSGNYSCDFPAGWVEFTNKFILNTFKS